MSASATWLKSLRVGNIITITWRGDEEDVEVVREYLPTRNKVCVAVKRKHLKQWVYLMEKGEWVSCRFSTKVGNEYLDFRTWRLRV